MFQSNKDAAWDNEAVFSLLEAIDRAGQQDQGRCRTSSPPSVPSSHYSVRWPSPASNVSSATTYTSCLQTLDVGNAIYDRIIIKENDKPTAGQVLASVVAAKVSLAYHSGIAYLLQLCRYADAGALFTGCAGSLQRGFTSSSLRQQGG
jgi:RNA polymerase I-associated factor PAF67